MENFLHFEESPEQFPIEFCLTFGGAFSKYSIEHFAKERKKTVDTRKILKKHKSITDAVEDNDV